MGSEATTRFELSQEGHQIAHVVVEEIPNSQNPQNTEHEYNPFVSQQLSQPGQSTQSQPGPSSQESQNRLSELASWSEVEFPVETPCEPKRRGRPPRESYQHLKPTRESQRAKQCPKVLNYERLTNTSWEWSEMDKEAFLAGCLDVGIEDIKGIRQYIPHKTERDIMKQISGWKNLAARRVEQCLEAGQDICGVKAQTLKNLDGWINLLKEKPADNWSFVMANYFSILAEYGEFPPPENSRGIDFRAMYRYLHCMMNGLPPCGLDSPTTQALMRCLDNVQQKLNNPNLMNGMQDHLFNQSILVDNERFGKTYSRKSGNSNPIDQILSSSFMNPLNLPKTAVMRMSVAVEKSDSEED